MIDTPTTRHEIEKPADDSTWHKPNLKGDWCNLFLLTLLYTMQGIPFGLSVGLPIIFQSKNIVTYDDQGSISYVLWPYAIRLLWAPIVDSFYVRWIGRRKSWFIPLQYLIAALLLYFAYNTDEWLPESGKPNLKMIVCLLLVINLLNTTQDIAVDSWALTMLKKNNVSYASTCNCIGIAIGMFIGSVCPILLSSEQFCNRYLRLTPGTGGIISIKNIIFLWGVVFLLITTLVTIFKKEKDTRLEDVKINIFQNYKLIWSLLKLSSMRVFLIAVLTSTIGYSTMDTVANLKLIDAGISKDDIMLMSTAMSIFRIFLPLPLAKYTGGPKPLSLYLKCTPIRLLWSVPYVLLIYYTPFLIKNNGVVNVPIYYYFILGFIFAIHELLSDIMIITHLSFFIKISDPRFGGTYLTLLGTARNLSWVIPNTVILKMVDILTFNKCSNDDHGSCSTTDLQNICSTKQGHNCVTILDGYYIEAAICMVIGFVWYAIFKSHYKILQSKNHSHWIVDVKRPISVYL
ncbi:unnamed protein product [Macrosiphum euphorbiae]|uniref:Acetyl-coenzyme A transporter 1 n=1 Tax=Macrosiphum euphorbiae TaxID=13131 RepID=A0AAV0XBK9_9HEMI|nr:unnamed protein product [Macrosiphum euphorbiae]